MKKLFLVPILAIFIYFSPMIFAMPNPASVYCENNWGKLEIINSSSWSTGMCTLKSWLKCEEWAYFRWECGKVTINDYKSCSANWWIIFGDVNKKQCEYNREVYVQSWTTIQLNSCLAYYDWCNSCTVTNWKIGWCTLMACSEEEITEPVCTLNFTYWTILKIDSNKLSLVSGDIVEDYKIHEKATIDNKATEDQFVKIEFSTDDNWNKTVTNITVTTYPKPKQWEFCGGIGWISCDTGLVCKLSDIHPDTWWICEKEDASTKICTMDYTPVCWSVEVKCEKNCNSIVYKTFGNKCALESNSKAKFAYNWACKDNLPIHSDYRISEKQKAQIESFIQKWSSKKWEKVVFNKMLVLEKMTNQLLLLSRLHNKKEITIEYLASNLKEIVFNNFNTRVENSLKDLTIYTKLTSNTTSNKFNLISQEWTNEPHLEDGTIIWTIKLKYTDWQNNFENSFVIKYTWDKLDIKLNK